MVILLERLGVEISPLGEDIAARPADLDLDLAVGAVPSISDIIAQNIVAAGKLLDLLDVLFVVVDDHIPQGLRGRERLVHDLQRCRERDEVSLGAAGNAFQSVNVRAARLKNL